MIVIRFFGAFGLTGPDGDDLTPRAVKAQAVLALLASVPDARRGRRWLEGQIWSGRDPRQASGSLRQALTEIRSHLGAHAGLLQADRQDVWLDRDRIRTDLDEAGPAPAPGRAFLEGLDLRGEPVQAWIDGMRRDKAGPAHAPTVLSAGPGITAATGPPNRPIRLRCISSGTGSRSERLVGRIIADQVGINIEERMSAMRLAPPATDMLHEAGDLEIVCDVAQDGAACIVFVRVQHPTSGRMLFSDHRKLTGTAPDAPSARVILGLAQSAATKTLAKLPLVIGADHPDAAAAGFAHLALGQLWRFDATSMARADDLMARAFQTRANGLYLAWRGFIRMAQMVDRLDPDRSQLLEEVEQLTRQALETAGDNGLALSLVALTRVMLEDDLEEPGALADLALRLNPNNIFAMQSVAVAKGAVGDAEAAYRLSLACQTSGGDDDMRHLWDLYHCLVCISAGRMAEAIEAGRRAAIACQGFLAPRRQLLTLSALDGNTAEAQRTLSFLRQNEPDFSLDRYLRDTAYPVTTLRKAGLLDIDPDLLRG